MTHMTQMNRMAKACVMWIGGLLLAASLTGCIGQGEYDRLYEANRSLTSRNSELQRERDEALRQVELMRGNIGASSGTLSDMQAQNAQLRALLDQAQADYRSLSDKIGQLQFGALDPVTSSQLEALAQQYPDLIKFDSTRGMLRFAADLTFDSGSDAVKPEAKSALGALANVLKSQSALQYVVVVEGHTDSQRMSGATASRHRSNRHLSAHRAISVIGELLTMGVEPGRLMAAGWGEFRPLVPNAGNGNTPQNRRVEIFLARDHATGTPAGESAPAMPTTIDPDRASPPERPADISK